MTSIPKNPPEPKPLATSTLVLGQRYLVKPKTGLSVLNPHRHGQPLPPEGCTVGWDTYWHRHLLDDAVLVYEPTQA